MEVMGARVGQFFGLRSWFICGEANGAAVAGATAVDIMTTERKENVEEVAIREGEKKEQKSEGTGVQALLDINEQVAKWSS